MGLFSEMRNRRYEREREAIDAVCEWAKNRSRSLKSLDTDRNFGETLDRAADELLSVFPPNLWLMQSASGALSGEAHRTDNWNTRVASMIVGSAEDKVKTVQS